jgi:integrase
MLIPEGGLVVAKVKTIFRQVDQLFSMSRKFGQSKEKIKNQGAMAGALTAAKTYDDYRAACMRWAEDLAERRGTKKFQICSVKSEEIKNFLERIALTHRPETVHHYCAALQKLENMTNERFGKVRWKIDQFEKPRRKREDVTVQRGPAYTHQEANELINKVARVNNRAADALRFIRATGCRAETLFGRMVKTGGKVVVNGMVVKGTKVSRDYEKAIIADRIDLVKGTVTLCEKGGKWRTVEYDRRYQSLMERLVKENPRGPVFAGLNQATMYKRIKKASHEVGIEGRGLHGMRKTFAVQRHREYIQMINDLVDEKDWRSLVKEFSITKQKAQAICRNPREKSVDNLARLKLSKDLGHNRIEVTYRYVVK